VNPRGRSGKRFGSPPESRRGRGGRLRGGLCPATPRARKARADLRPRRQPIPNLGQRLAVLDDKPQAVDLLKSNCPTYQALTPVVRLEAMEQLALRLRRLRGLHVLPLRLRYVLGVPKLEVMARADARTVVAQREDRTSRAAQIFGGQRVGAVEICGAGATWGTGAADGANPPLLGCAPAVVVSAMETMTNVAVRMFDCNTKRDLIGAPINRPSGVLVAPVQVPALAL
jgi:hypothetical protein